MRHIGTALVATTLGLSLPLAGRAQEQSRESAALDNTAAAWSFQLAGQAMPDYRQDTLASGEIRPEGNKGYAQFRMVAPVKVAGVSVLPRLTMRYSQNKDGEWGFSPTDLFALILPFDWGTGRAGFGPDIVIPGSSKVGSSEWSYGLAGAVIQRFFNDKMIVGLLVQQLWGQRTVVDLGQPVPIVTDEIETGAHPLIINPFITAQLGKGWYLSTNDMVAQYSWEFGGWKVPLGLRFGYVLVNPSNSWNFYVEYATEFATDDWPGAAARNKYRANISYSVPVG
ncbi:MAG: hypothetical protein WBN79_11500 [Gemmatimonadota bacterium]